MFNVLVNGACCNCTSVSLSASVVRSSEAPAGMDNDMAINPWSSEGIKPVGVFLTIQMVATSTTAKPAKLNQLKRTRKRRLLTYFLVNRLKPELKPIKNFSLKLNCGVAVVVPCCSFKNNAHNAGL